MGLYGKQEGGGWGGWLEIGRLVHTPTTRSSPRRGPTPQRSAGGWASRRAGRAGCRRVGVGVRVPRRPVRALGHGDDANGCGARGAMGPPAPVGTCSQGSGCSTCTATRPSGAAVEDRWAADPARPAPGRPSTPSAAAGTTRSARAVDVWPDTTAPRGGGGRPKDRSSPGSILREIPD